MGYKKYMFLLGMFYIYGFNDYQLPEIYQDVVIKGEVVQQGIRSCNDRYEAIRGVLASLPQGFKVLDIGASQGYFSFRAAEEFGARCVMVEDGYSITNYTWNTAQLLRFLCEQNSHLENIVLLQKRIFAQELRMLRERESFDVVFAFSVIHHMRRNAQEPYQVYEDIIDEIVALAPVVLIENPVNTGEHTIFIRNALRKRDGKLLYQSNRDTLVYEIYLFDRRNASSQQSSLASIQRHTYTIFNGVYPYLEREGVS